MSQESQFYHRGIDTYKKCRNCQKTGNLVKTDIGFYCVDCLKDKVLIYPDNNITQCKDKTCCRCKCYVHEFPISIADVTLCRHCLEILVEQGLNRNI